MTQEAVRKRFWKRVIVALMIVFVVLPILTVVGIAIFRYERRKPTPIETIVPNLKGLDLKTAESRARQAQLNPQVMLRRWDIPAPLGTVVGQIPGAGMVVPVGTTVGMDLCVEDPSKPQIKQTKP